MKEALKRAQRKYKEKLKIREVKFNLTTEAEIYNFSKTINFSKLVKEALRKEASENGNRNL